MAPGLLRESAPRCALTRRRGRSTVQVTIRGVHVRLEAHVQPPRPGHPPRRPVALGLTLRELSLRSCGAGGEDVFVDAAQGAAPRQLHKRLCVDGLGCHLANPEGGLQLSRQFGGPDGRCLGADRLPTIVVRPFGPPTRRPFEGPCLCLLVLAPRSLAALAAPTLSRPPADGRCLAPCAHRTRG